MDTRGPRHLRQTLDVLDFATPVKSVSSFEQDGTVRLEIEPVDRNFEHVSYQANNIFTIEFKPISKKELDEKIRDKFGYTGDRLSLNFQDIPVRAVLQLLADFTGLNIRKGPDDTMIHGGQIHRGKRPQKATVGG